MTSPPNSTLGDHYGLATDQSGHARLRLLCEMCDPHSRAWISKAGLNSTHRYVEFGCGLGYVARWAASVAANVTAIDLSDEHLREARRLAEQADLHNMEWRNASIYEHQLPASGFDYAYARFLFVHLNRPIEAMRSVYTALKPGGLMVCEDVDSSAFFTEPPSAAYEQVRDLAMRAGKQRGVDYAGGRRLHTWARAAGFDIVDVGAYQLVHLTGPHKRLLSLTFLEAAPALVEAKVMSQEQLQRLAEGMQAADEDPAVLMAQAPVHQVIASKPR